MPCELVADPLGSEKPTLLTTVLDDMNQAPPTYITGMLASTHCFYQWRSAGKYTHKYCIWRIQKVNMALFLANILTKYYWPTKQFWNCISFLGCANNSRKRHPKGQEKQILACLTLFSQTMYCSLCTVRLQTEDCREWWDVKNTEGYDSMYYSRIWQQNERFHKNIKLGQTGHDLLNRKRQDHRTQRNFLAVFRLSDDKQMICC